MDVRPGYKQTEVGTIPEEWRVSTVGQEFEVKFGKMLDAEKNVGTPKPYLGNKAVQWNRIDYDDLPTVPMSQLDMERYRLEKDDLLVCEGGEVGRAAIWHAPIRECYYQKALTGCDHCAVSTYESWPRFFACGQTAAAWRAT